MEADSSDKENKWTQSIAARPVKCSILFKTGFGSRTFVETMKEALGF